MGKDSIRREVSADVVDEVEAPIGLDVQKTHREEIPYMAEYDERTFTDMYEEGWVQ
jgi:hypothetical protein